MRSLDSMPRKGIVEKVLCDERGRLCNIRGNTRAEASREVLLACFRNYEAASVVQGWGRRLTGEHALHVGLGGQ